jgi:hypothetical protein
VASIPNAAKRRVARALQRHHQVRLPFISTRGRVQIGSGLHRRRHAIIGPGA